MDQLMNVINENIEYMTQNGHSMHSLIITESNKIYGICCCRWGKFGDGIK